jgi:DNA-directed RNA polymerase subunit RPC12/RpoP
LGYLPDPMVPSEPVPGPPPVPEAVHPPESARHAFACDNCGAELRWDPDADALHCEHCQTTRAVPRGEGVILERPLAEAGAAARGLGRELRVAACQECGARVSFEEASTAASCVYCGSPSVLAQEANRNAIRPESLVPLDVGRAAVEQAFRAWLKGLWFRPAALQKTKRFAAVGVYVPFWTYDCRVHSDWTADAGYYYWVTEHYTVTVNGKTQTRTRQVRKIRWVPAWGQRDDAYDDVLVHASGGLSEELVEELGAFDTSALVPYRPEYLAGWRAEEYALDLESGWDRAAQHVVREQERRCAGDVPGDTHRFLRVTNHIADPRWKHVLLPVWSLSYRYRGKVYPVLVHGQTGRVVGRAPWSAAKIAGLVLFLAAAALLVVLAVQA